MRQLKQADKLEGTVVHQYEHLNLLEKQISDWLGDGAKFIRNEAGDPCFLSKDGLKCVRFDFNRTNPHNNPHAHIEV